MRDLLTELAHEFWAGRAAAAAQPDTQDDLTRIERPPGWVCDWSTAAVHARRLLSNRLESMADVTSVGAESFGYFLHHVALLPYSAQRLRAMRTEIDIGLALGDLTVGQAAQWLTTAVPMDEETAWQEAAFFGGNPGQSLSYRTGKLQILELLAERARDQGGDFSLQEFHDRLWLEGNVPLVLQRWELLSGRDQLDTADQPGRENQ